MRITYTPDSSEARTWDVDPDRLMSPEAELIETKTGLTFPEAWGAAVQGSTKARRAILYVLEKRANPALAWDGFTFAVGSVEFRPDKAEIDGYEEAIRNAPVDEEARAQALAALEVLREQAADAAPLVVTEPGSGLISATSPMPSGSPSAT